MTVGLGRRATAEAVGTGLLVAVVIGSGIAASGLTDDSALVLLANAAATAGGLVALLSAFGAISGAHLNPIVTLAEHALGRVSTRDAAAYIGAQLSGGAAGAMVANAMFDLAPITLSTQQRASSGLWLGEVVATFGLLTVVLSLTRSQRDGAVPYAVAGYIAAGYWFTSSTSFANPAVTAARSLTDTFTGISPTSVPGFVAAQAVGGAAALVLAGYLHRRPTATPVPLGPDAD